MNRIYISGKITGLDRGEYLDKFKRTQIQIEAYGYETINPAEVCDLLPTTLTWEDYMKICLPLIELCDTIFLMKGYESSKGAIAEMEYAKSKGLKILYEV